MRVGVGCGARLRRVTERSVRSTPFWPCSCGSRLAMALPQLHFVRLTAEGGPPLQTVPCTAHPGPPHLLMAWILPPCLCPHYGDPIPRPGARCAQHAPPLLHSRPGNAARHSPRLA